MQTDLDMFLGFPWLCRNARTEDMTPNVWPADDV